MDKLIENMEKAIKHLDTLQSVFAEEENYDDKKDFPIYKRSHDALNDVLDQLNLSSTIYGKTNRQLILADLIEYFFFGRGYYSIKDDETRGLFIKSVLYFVNVLMSFETITVSKKLRDKYLDSLKTAVAEVGEEPTFNDLRSFEKEVGLPANVTQATPELDKYFDSLLPKTAGGLWHEMLTFIFMLRNDLGYIIPLLLSQRFLGLRDSLVPPDFLIIAKDKRIYGVEVGTKKEIQSGGFSLKTAIPTATVDTENSRTSDRCPICHKWIQFCDHVINTYSDLSNKSLPNGGKSEFRCLRDGCSIYTKEQVAAGQCPYTKYSRKRKDKIKTSHHEYSDGKHYHYQCVLDKVSPEMKDDMISNPDKIALKTHFPYYPGLEGLMKKRSELSEEDDENEF
ncbi:MAG: hypothetical protein ACP5OC_08240 [Thermoplasmata archaeon]